MKKATKGQKATAALEGLILLMNRADLSLDSHIKIALMAGRWGAINRYRGYLTGKQIDEELEIMFSQEMGGIIKDAYLERLEDRDG